MTRLNNDVLGAQQAFTDILSSVVSNLVSVTLVLAAMIFLSWKITLVALIMLPVFVVPARRIGRKLGTIVKESYALNAQMNTTMTERFNVSGALLVKLFGHPDQERDEFNQRAGRVRDIGVTQAMYGRVFFTSLTLTAALATALVYGWGGVLAAHNLIQVGTVVALTAYLNRLYGPLTALSNVNIDVMTALSRSNACSSKCSIFEPMIQERPGAVAITAVPPPGIRACRLQLPHRRGGVPRLFGIRRSAGARATETGPLRRLLPCRSWPARGARGTVGSGQDHDQSSRQPSLRRPLGGGSDNGVDLRDATLDSIRDEVGVVTQDAHLFHETIRANMQFARPDATDAEIMAAIEQAQVLPLVESLPDGLDTVVGDRGYRLSGGEKQRVAIARLLIKAPDVVVLDEATAHLDSESELAVQDALRTALAGRTSIVIAHRLSTVLQADQILVVDDGRIVERGRHDELLAMNGLYSDLYRTQFERQQYETPEPAGPPSGAARA